MHPQHRFVAHERGKKILFRVPRTKAAGKGICIFICIGRDNEIKKKVTNDYARLFAGHSRFMYVYNL